MDTKLISKALALVFLLVLSTGSAFAMEGGCPMMQHGGGRHEGGKAGHYLHHLLKHQKEIGLSADQVAKIKAMKLDLAKTAAKSKADIKIARLELDALVEDPNSDLKAIEAKLTESAKLKTALRLAAIKAKREAMALLTPEQLEKEKAEHEKMMQQMREGGGRGGGGMGGMMGGGMMGQGRSGSQGGGQQQHQH